MATILLDKGQRGIIVGQTGSGKTVGAIWQLQHSPLYPVVIFDTKIEPTFNNISRDAEEIAVYNSLTDFIKGWQEPEQPGYVIVRPSATEVYDMEGMDAAIASVYDMSRPALYYFDELYNWHINGRAGPGLIGLLTRGRSKGLTTLMSTQRPAWISRFCFSEAQKYYIYKIGDGRDSKTISEFLPGYEDMTKPPRHGFIYYDSSSGKSPELYKPVPKPSSQKPVIDDSGHRWI